MRIFWIEGADNSGKSTLIEFLRNNSDAPTKVIHLNSEFLGVKNVDNCNDWREGFNNFLTDLDTIVSDFQGDILISRSPLSTLIYQNALNVDFYNNRLIKQFLVVLSKQYSIPNDISYEKNKKVLEMYREKVTNLLVNKSNFMYTECSLLHSLSALCHTFFKDYATANKALAEYKELGFKVW